MRIHGLLWLFAVVVTLLVSPVLVVEGRYQQVITQEMAEAERWYGENELARVAESCTSLYQALFVKSGIEAWVKANGASPAAYRTDAGESRVVQPIAADWDSEQQKFVRRESPTWVVDDGARVLRERVQEAVKPFVGYGHGLLANLYLMCWRAAQFALWVVYLVPFGVAIIIDGILVRKVKLASFQYTSPTVYNLSWHAIISLALGAVLGAALVVPIPVLVYPAVVSTMGLLTRLVVGNIQHSA